MSGEVTSKLMGSGTVDILKGYEALTTLAQHNNREIVEKRFWQEIEKFKKERQNNGTIIID